MNDRSVTEGRSGNLRVGGEVCTDTRFFQPDQSLMYIGGIDMKHFSHASIQPRPNLPNCLRDGHRGLKGTRTCPNWNEGKNNHGAQSYWLASR